MPLQAAGRRDAAESAYRKTVELLPNHAEAYANLGVVLAEGGKKDAAREAFKKAISLNPELVPAYVGLADLVDDGTWMRWRIAARCWRSTPSSRRALEPSDVHALHEREPRGAVRGT